jgi:Cu-processing system permease protein
MLQALFLVAEMITAGADEISGFNRMTGRLLNLNLILLPLMGLLIGGLSVSGDKEDRQWLLLTTYPLSSRQWIAGKFAGLALTFLGMIAFTYGVLGMVGYFLIPGGNASHLLLFMAGSFILILIFLGAGLVIGSAVDSRLETIAASVLAWFFSLFILPFAAINTASLLPSGSVGGFLVAATLLNPTEFVRVAVIFLSGSGSVLGTPFYDLNHWFHSLNGTIFVSLYTLLYTAALVWLAGAIIQARRRRR